MKNIIALLAFVFLHQFVFAQKTEFTVNKERAIYEKNKLNIQIIQSKYKTSPGQVITASLQNLIIDLMTNKKGFVSVEFLSDTELIVEYQENLDQSLVLKNINRQGIQFIFLPPEVTIER